MGAGVRVLKIDVQVDESGEARRNLGEIDQGVTKIEQSAGKGSGSVVAFSKNVSGLGTEADAAAESITGASGAIAAAAPILGTTAVATAGLTAAILAATAAVAGIGEVVRESIQHYLEQSDVLDVNREALHSLSETWDGLKFAIGEAIVGTDGDFTPWIHRLEAGLVILQVKLESDIALFKELASLVAHTVTGPGTVGQFGGDPKDTRRRNTDGSLTEFGKQSLGDYLIDGLDSGATALNKAREARLSRQEIEGERAALHDLTRDTNEILKSSREYLQTQHQLAEELHRVGQAAREAYDAEIGRAFMGNLKTIKGLTSEIRDDFAELALSGAKLKEFQINEAARRAAADVDPRAENAGAVLQKLEAERQLHLLMMKKDTQGVTDELQQQFLIFRQTYQDVLQGLPETLEAQIPAITAASSEIRDTMTSDIESVGSHATQTFQAMAVVIHKTSADLKAEAAQIENDLADMVNKGQQGPFGYRQFQEQLAQQKRDQAGYVARQESFSQPWGLPHFAEGVTNFRGGAAVVGERGPEIVRLPGGSSVIPNGRGAGEGRIGPVTIDLRGAVIANAAALEQFTDSVQRKLATLFERYGR